MTQPSIHLIFTTRLHPSWQWRWEEGCAQALQVFRTAAEMLREDPRLSFSHGEAWAYLAVERLDPPLFREIQHLAADRRWCVSGGWWVEPELRYAGLEALIRNLAFARKYFLERFKARPRVACALETIGLPPGLPQLLRQAGYELLLSLGPESVSHPGLTTSLADSRRLVRWLGADDSDLAGLRIPVGFERIDSQGLGARLEAARDLALLSKQPVPVFWGLGDAEGGGGRDDLRRINDFRSANGHLEVVHGTFEGLLELLSDALAGLPISTDDGLGAGAASHTSHARIKRRARRSLGLLTQTESLCAAAWSLREAQYPEEELLESWRSHVTNDAQKSLSGSLTEAGALDTLDLYGKAEEVLRRLRLVAAVDLQRGVPWRVSRPLVVLNANPGLARMPLEAECSLDHGHQAGGEWHLRVFSPDGTEVPCQEEPPASLLPSHGWRRKVVFGADLPGVGASYFKVEVCPGTRRLWPAPAALSHVIDPSRGLLTSLEPIQGLECLRGPLFEPLVFEDLGGSSGHAAAVSGPCVGRFKLSEGPRVLVKGPIRSVTESVLCFAQSRIVMRVVAYAGWPVLELQLRIHWNEHRKRLKLTVPTVFASAAPRCESAGANFFLPADGLERWHGRWFALGGQVGGKSAAIAVVHCGQHGLEASEGEARISVLRSVPSCHESGQKLDDSDCELMDQGVHDLRFLITAGEVSTVIPNLSGLADWLDAPPSVLVGLSVRLLPHQNRVDFLSLEPLGVRLCACKRSSDKLALVLRIAESLGVGCEAVLRLGNPKVEAHVFLKPFEIKTLRIERGGQWRETDGVNED